MVRRAPYLHGGSIQQMAGSVRFSCYHRTVHGKSKEYGFGNTCIMRFLDNLDCKSYFDLPVALLLNPHHPSSTAMRPGTASRLQ